MSVFERWSLSPDQDRPAEPRADRAGEPAKDAALQIPAERRSHGQAYAETLQLCESGWGWHQRFEAPRGELALFRPERVGLTAVSPEEADRYIERRRGVHPWLAAAERASPEARRVLVALDLGTGHGHIRHDGWVTEEASMRRVAYLEDPAQLDPAKRVAGTDGLEEDGKRHVCGRLATRITDPDAFATAFVRGVEHPEVRAALERPYDKGKWPDPVRVPIAELLGEDGHKFCTGWRLVPVHGDMKAAVENRDKWQEAMAGGIEPTVPRPLAWPVSTFKEGHIAFVIRRDEARDRLKIETLLVQPSK